ncbi:hypothetical protein P5673_023496 [Acropora cervicornis]|uniref:SAP domain-containing protein n=1 Tax=Acropora cervicornis TaxID=6130 RepID=A0AAD9UYX3_ACRCE|nr:hypothetical protein P5673_023496 [Acropora cervicornis]
MRLKSKIPLCSDYSEYSVADLRTLVVSAVKSDAEAATQPQQQGASNKDSINNNFENLPFTDCDNDNNNRSSHQADCDSNVNGNHDSNDNTKNRSLRGHALTDSPDDIVHYGLARKHNNSSNRSSDNGTDYSNHGNNYNCKKSDNTYCNINNNIYDFSDSTNDLGVDNRHLRLEKLKPEDIPAAVIENESQIGKWTVEKLKFWLKCRRLNQQGNKKQLLEKVLAFKTIPKYRDDVYDPDAEKSYSKAKLQYGR